MVNSVELRRIKRHRRIRLSVKGSNQRPRLCIHRSHKHLFCQLVDDTANKTLFSMSTLDKEIRKSFPLSGNVKSASFFGETFAMRAKEKGFTKVVFDRAGFAFHGRIKAFVESLRKGGLEF